MKNTTRGEIVWRSICSRINEWVTSREMEFLKENLISDRERDQRLWDAEDLRRARE
jgi:hypothetical protein